MFRRAFIPVCAFASLTAPLWADDISTQKLLTATATCGEHVIETEVSVSQDYGFIQSIDAESFSRYEEEIYEVTPIAGSHALLSDGKAKIKISGISTYMKLDKMGNAPVLQFANRPCPDGKVSFETLAPITEASLQLGLIGAIEAATDQALASDVNGPVFNITMASK